MKYAFRCKSCGKLHAGSHAGDGAIPHSCMACGRGVTLGNFKELSDKLKQSHLSEQEKRDLDRQLQSPILTKTFQPDNWEILADLTAEQLSKYEITPEDVERHNAPNIPAVAGRHVSVDAQDGSGTKNSM